MVLIFLLLFVSLFAEEELRGQKVVLASKQIYFPEYPDAFNPSLLRIEDGFLLVFRYCPDRIWKSHISYIGIGMLDENFNPISQPQLLSTRRPNSKTPCQSEDPRVFSYRGRNFIVFNDNIEIENPTTGQRRDIYLAELLQSQGNFSLSSSVKLFYKEKYNMQWWQKNWIPFTWNKKLLFVYSINPHEIVELNLIDGKCYLGYESFAELNWEWGTPRGSTPGLLVDGEYLSFFHSGIKMASEASGGCELWHYFMGAYTFSPLPPFKITKITPSPIIGEGFYTTSYHEKRVIFPGGYVAEGPYIYVAYGKDDDEMWIATLDKEALQNFLKPVAQE